MEFLITAFDGKDSGALQRRLAAREAHLDGVASMKEEGSFIAGGAILDDSGQMIGSTLYVAFQSREKLDQWLFADPYVTGKVWEDIDVRPIKLVPQNK